MRIKKLRFKNLNSLFGEWEIDFSDPVFLNEGIFAITGPTGSGKTTILDAISLALYGNTRRLGRIAGSQGSNEIISKGAGDCFSEVFFDVGGKSYRAIWWQHRAKKKADGKLQKVNHEFSIIDCGGNVDIIARKETTCTEIADVLNMDFSQFTRSVMLCQGSFSAFLDSDGKDRAAYFEKITGSRIYADISKKVFARAKAETDIYERLLIENKSLEVLSPQEEAAIENRLTAGEAVLADKLAARDKLAADISVTQRLTEYEKEQASIIAALAELDLKQPEIDLLQSKLELSARASGVVTFYERFNKTALELAKEKDGLKLRKDKSTVLEDSLKEKLVQHEDLEKDYYALQHDSELFFDRLNAASETETLLKSKRELYDKNIAEKNVSEQRRTDLLSAIEELEKVRRALNADMEKSRFYLEKNSAGKALVVNLNAIFERFKSFSLSNELIQTAAKDISARETKLSELAVRLSAAESTFIELKTTKESLEKQYLDCKARVLQSGINPGELRQQRLDAEKGLQSLEKAIELGKSFDAQKLRLSKISAESLELAEKQKKYSVEIVHLAEEISHLKKIVSLIKETAELSDLRGHLIDGEPCPLCGSTSHPYAGDTPENDYVKRSSELKMLEQRESQMQKEAVVFSGRLELLQKSQLECSGEIGAIESRLSSLDFASRSVSEMEELLSLQKNELSVLEDKIAAHENLESQMRKTADDLASVLPEYSKCELETSEIRSSIKNEKDAIELLNNQKTQKENELAVMFSQCISEFELAQYGVDSLAYDTLRTVYLSLKKRADEYSGHASALENNEKKLAGKEPELAALMESLANVRKESAKLEESLDSLEKELSELARKRRQFFDGDDIESARSAAKLRLDVKRSELEASSAAVQGMKEELARVSGAGEISVKRIAELEILLKESERLFEANLLKSGFPGREEFEQAVITEEIGSGYQKTVSGYLKEKEFLNTRKDELKKNVMDLKGSISEKPYDEMKDSYDLILNEISALEREFGGLDEKLRQNREKHRHSSELAGRIQCQRSVCSRWNELNSLIGSAQGDKYRKFVQSITFNILLELANTELLVMTERYSLVPRLNSSLEIDVLDHYSSGLPRPIENLSGGEKFIISLALALGLSRLSSGKQKMDSLFLDEGFGTLDEKSLEMAISALARVQREGKQICIISHVPLIRERIPLKIEVVPLGATGRSELTGPGVSRKNH